MSWPSRLKILFCVQVFFGFCAAIINPECESVELIKPLRSKRSGNDPVHITINAFGLSTPTLYAVEGHDLISRIRTGVWSAQFSSFAYQNVAYYPWPHIFDDIGDFEFLQNVEEGTAVTRFWDSHGNVKIVGILKQNYTITSVPRDLEYAFIDISQEHVREERSVNSMNDQNRKRLILTICKDAKIPHEYFRHDTYVKNDVRPDSNLHRPIRQITNLTKVEDVVYPKLLVIPDARIIKRYTHVRDFMVQLIAQLNCIDMMFRQLKDPEVHLNIAGIIIPMDETATPYMLKHINADKRIIGDDVLFEAARNFRNENRRFPHDEWESILMLTTYPIAFHIDDTGSLVEVDGFSAIGQGCSEAVGIVKFTDDLKGAFNLAHELGHMFGAPHDKAKEPCNGDNSFLMGAYGYSTKIEWSNCSRTALQTNFRSNAEQCTYSRLRSIPNKVKSMPGAWLTIDGRCNNLYNDSTGYCINERSPDCFIYGCVRNGKCDWSLDPPLEGTLFFYRYGLQACVNETMVPV